MQYKLKNIKINQIFSFFMFICLFLALVGMSWSWFSAIVTGNDTAKTVTVTNATLSIQYTDSPQITLNNAMPGSSVTKTFTVKNTGDKTTYYNIEWAALTNGFADKTDLVYKIESTNNNMSYATMPNTGTNISIMNYIKIESNVTHSYTMTILFRNKNESQNDNQSKVVSGKLQITTNQSSVGTTPTLANMIKTHNPPTTYTTVPGRVASTTAEGLIEGPNDDYGDTTYYFRGTAPDNYVSFAGKTWRIVRINGDGSVRLVLDTSTGTNSAWNTNWSSTTWSTALSYATYGNSIIKENAETWYNNNIGNNENYSSKVVPTMFCNDRTYDVRLGYYIFGASMRLNDTRYTVNPSFICPTNTSEGNDIYNLNVGLLTADEITFAGAVYSVNTTSYYLYKADSTRWTMSPYQWNVGGATDMFWIDSSYLDSNHLNAIGDVYPVISLFGDVPATVNATNPGTSSNPYVVQ